MVAGRSFASTESVMDETLEHLVARGDGFSALGLIDETSALTG